ncbi:hypothetical protein, partial [uncultured Psychrobacter sp.]|uniref:hypothetical protein n=1 Tax=uncultured Psychrobacter sp. TaxID=259303 RepID=UPI0030DCD31C
LSILKYPPTLACRGIFFVCGLVPVLSVRKFSIGCFYLIYSSKRITMFIIKKLEGMLFFIESASNL